MCSSAVVAGRPALQRQCICFGLLVRISACYHCPSPRVSDHQRHSRDRSPIACPGSERDALIEVHEFQFIRVTGTVLLYEPQKHAGRRHAVAQTNKRKTPMIEIQRNRRISLLSLVLSIIALDPYPIHRNRARPYISSACCILFSCDRSEE